jgi:hypothetical protein
MPIYEILPALDLTQSVHAIIFIGMHWGVKFKISRIPLIGLETRLGWRTDRKFLRNPNLNEITFSQEVVLVTFELQTHMEHLSSCRSRVLVVFGKGLLNLQFSVYCILNFLSAIKYLSFCFVIPVYLYHILLMK